MARTKTAKRTGVKADVRLRLPCELVTTHLLPLIRAKLAHELVRERRVSQLRAARVLAVTQPAIHNYLRSKPVPRREELGDSLDGIDAMIEELAGDICEGRITQTEALTRVCGLCFQMRNRGAMCEIHGKAVPSIVPGQCSFCLQDLTALKRRSLEEYQVTENVRQAVRLMENTWELSHLIPEIGMNIVMAKPEARGVDEVVGIPGRVRPIAGRPYAAGPPQFGGSSHVANAVLTIIGFDPSVRSAVSLRFDPLVLEICEGLGSVISFFDRSEEPPEVKRVDGRTIPWGIERAVRRVGRAPDVVYDLGDVGKEPMIFLFGKDALDVAYSAVRVAKEYLKRKAKT